MAGETNPYDNLINLAPSNNQGPSSTPSMNPYDSILEEQNVRQDAELNLILREASTIDPVNQAEVQRISRETGIPQDLVGRNQEEVLREWGARRARTAELSRNNPILARQLNDRDFAAIAWDDLPNLTNTEALVRFFSDLPEDAAAGYNRGVNTNEMGYIGHRAQIGTATPEDLIRFKELQELDRETGRLGVIGNTTTILGQMLDSQLDPVVTGLYTGAGYAGAVAIAGQLGPQVAIPEEIVTVPAGFGTGFYAGYMAKNTEQAFRIEAGHSYMEMIEAGVDRRTAQYVSTGVGLTNAALNFVGLSMVASPVKSALTRAMTQRVAANLTRPGTRSAMAAFGLNYTRAVAGETATEVAQELVTLFGTEIGKSFSEGEFEYLMNTPAGREQIAETVVETMRVVGQGMSVLALPGASFNLAVDVRASRQAKRDQQFIQDLGFLADQSQVQSRNPEAYQQFLAAQTNGTPVENLYIDAVAMGEVLQQQGITPEQLEQVIPGISEQLVEAQATGGDIIIPTSVYGAKIAGTNTGNAMTEHLRVSLDSMSAKEAIEFQGKQQEMMQDAQKTLAEKMETNKEFNAQAATVRKTILDMVKKTGQYSEKVSATYADFVRDFVVVNSEKMNMSPQAFYERYMYRITGQMQDKQAMEDQDILASEGFVNQATNEVIPASKPFQDWFGASTLVDEEGAPNVIYHGTADNISEFDLDNPNRLDSGWLGTGIYMTDSPILAKIYAEKKAQKKRTGQVPDDGVREQIMPLYARLENPYYATLDEKYQVRAGGRAAADAFTKDLTDKGYDGVIMPLDADSNEIVVFDPSAVKSVFNDGTWSRESSQLLSQGTMEAIDQAAEVGISEGAGRSMFYQGKSVPQRTVKAYKLFRVDPKQPGKLFPLFVNSNNPVVMGDWVDAEIGPMGKGGKVKSKIGELAFRPGWHAGDLPIATHIGSKSQPGITAPDSRPSNQVWAEVEFPADVDWQTEANSRAQRNKQGEVISRTAHVTDQLPEGGHYRYKTNPNMTGEWLIGGAMKVNRVLSDTEVAEINNEAGVQDLQRLEPRADEGMFFQRASAQKPGKEVPTNIDTLANVEQNFDFAASQQFATNREFKLAIQARINSAAKAARVDLGDFTVGVEQYLVRVTLADALVALQTNPNAVGWYNEKVTKALRLLSLVHPELATDQEAKFAFTWALASTSNGLKVDKNFELAEVAYRYYKENGAMPTDIKAGTAQSAINLSMKLFNNLVARDGIQAVEQFMTTMHKAKDVEAYTGFKVSGESASTMVYGAAAIGPKIGNGFFANLYGHFEQLTMDRWLMRTWGRWTGTLVEINAKQIKAKRDQLKALIKTLDKDQKKAFEAIIKTKLAIGNIDAVGNAIKKASMKPANRVLMNEIGLADDSVFEILVDIFGEPKGNEKRVSLGDQMRKVGNSLAGYMDGQKEAPSGPVERRNIRKVFQQALTLLQQEQPSLTMADLQALLWYPEKRLYDAAKTKDEQADTGYEDEAAPDYANAAAALAKDMGVSEDLINQTIQEVDNELRTDIISTGDSQPGAGELLQRGRDGGGSYSGGSLAPLEGAPSIDGATGPDLRLVSVAERYAAANGIDLRRQSEFARVDVAQAQRIAQAYEDMQHDPLNPTVAEAYQNLINQTMAQYQALVEAGYEFFFFDENNDPYVGNPWNAMRDLRANQRMGVYATDAGFGSDPTAGAVDQNVQDNPLLADTGLVWMMNGEPKPVLANDLFRAVHDAFGHGIEGAGFRARGEENAWQAHIRLYTGSAQGALTSETRGQNSWLNFGPFGEKNQTAQVIDTIFADQKTGLMPEFSWQEGRVPDQVVVGEDLRQESVEASEQQAQARGAQFNQTARGAFNPSKLTTMINQGADYSTFLHETAHFYLTVYADMATLPEATPEMQQDMQTILDFFGVKDIGTWNAMTLEQQRKYHESFAYNFEIYLFEGKAPNTAMQEMFNKFSRWLTTVYRHIVGELNALYRLENNEDLPILTDEIRGVMDRMVASEEQIAQAEGVRNMRGMFQTQEQSKMDDATWAAYQEALAEAQDTAVIDLQRASIRQVKWLNNARSRLIKELQKEAETTRRQTRTAISEEVIDEPVYRVMEFIKRGIIDGQQSEFSGKLSIQEIEAMYGKGEMLDSIRKVFGYGKYGMLGKENGMHPEQVAEMFGFPSGYAMIQSILNARPMKEEIDARTEQRMMEENADMMDEKSIEVQVEQALHNEARARFIGAELRFLSKSTRPVRAMTAAAKQVAQQILSEKQLNKIKTHEFSRAEARAAKEADKASKAGEPTVAARAKQNQLVQNQLAKEALATKQEVAKALQFFKKLQKADKTLSKSRNMDLVNAARSILAAYGLGKSDVAPAKYIEKIKAYDPDLYDQLEPLIIDASSGGKPYQMMTLNEFRSMRDMVEALWFQSKREKQVMIDGQAMQLEEVVGELKARLDEIGIPERMPGETEAPTQRDFFARGLNTGKALLRRVEHWANATDGAAGTGAFTKYIWRPVRDAVTQYRIQRNDFVKRYAELIAKLDLPAMKITSNELGYTFGSANGGLGKAELLGALFHTGNPSNYRKLLLGGRGPGKAWGKLNADGTLDTAGWDTFIDRMISEGVLTKADFDFVQSVWDLTEEMKPIAQKAHKDIFGYYFNEVQAEPITTPFGVYRGGYVPAKVDPFLVGDATRNQKIEELEADFRQSMPSTGMGFTKSRVDYNKPLDLDVRKMTAHIDSVLRFAYIQPAIKDVLKIVKNRDFSDTLNAIDPGAIEGMILPWLNRAARQQTSTPGMYRGMDKFWQGVRNRTGISIMFANISNALQQATGYFPALLLVNKTYLKSSMWDYMKRPTQVSEEVAQMSPFMADRMKNQIFDIQETLNDLLLNPSKYQKVAKWTQKHGYFLQQAFQNQVDVVVWSATYNQTLAEMDVKTSDKKAQKEAIAKADANVRLSQDSLAAEDIAAFQVGSPFYKTLIQFTGYFNMLANLNADEYVKIFRDLGWRGNKGKLFMTYLLGFGLPMLMADAIVRTLGGQWEDEDEDGYIDDFAEWFFGSQIRGAVAMIPFGSSLAVPFNSLNDKPYDDRMATSPSVSTLEAIAVGLPRTVINLVDDDKEVTGKNVRDTLTALSLATGIPFTVLGRPLGYAIDVERDKIDPSSEVDYIRGIITGKASEGTR